MPAAARGAEGEMTGMPVLSGPPGDLVTVSVAKVILGLRSRTWVHELIARGELQGWRTPARVLVSRAEVEQLARKRAPQQVVPR